MVDKQQLSRMNSTVQKNEHWLSDSENPKLDSLHWDLLRYFLEVAETQSFRSAAENLNISTNSVRKRVDELEREMNCILFLRTNKGVELTMDGRTIYPIALEIENSVSHLRNIAVQKTGTVSGSVRLGVTEGLGGFWLPQTLPILLDEFPKLKLDLRNEMRVQDISMTDCHLTVQYERPRNEELIAKKLGTLHFIPFATQSYIDKHGSHVDPTDLSNHSMVHLVAEQVPAHILEQKVTNDPLFKFVKLVTNTSTAQVFAIGSGSTAGFLPTYAKALNSSLIPLNTNLVIKRKIWLVYSKEMIRLKRVRKVADWIIDSFDSKRYPWFSDDFVDPNSFEVLPSILQVGLKENSEWQPKFKTYLMTIKNYVDYTPSLDEAIKLLNKHIEDIEFSPLQLERLIAHLRKSNNLVLCEKVEYIRSEFYNAAMV